MSITAVLSLPECLLSVLIVKKLTAQGRKVRAREREEITHSPLFLGVFTLVELLRESHVEKMSSSVVSSLKHS